MSDSRFPDRNELIAKMWEIDGLSSGEIAKALKVTRGTVMGVIHRFKQNGRVFLKKNSEEAVTIHIKVRKEPVVKKIQAKPIRSLVLPLPEPEKFWTTLDPNLEKGITIFDLNRNSCRYIISEIINADTRYCGEVVDGRALCKAHRSLCYYYAKPSTARSAVTC